MIDPTPKLYHYNARLLAIYDGDTITCDVDLGMNVTLQKQKLRLYGINTPELHGAEKAKGEEAREELRRLAMGKPLVIETIKDEHEKYGRLLANVYVQDDGAWICVNDRLVSTGHAKIYKP